MRTLTVPLLIALALLTLTGCASRPRYRAGVDQVQKAAFGVTGFRQIPPAPDGKFGSLIGFASYYTYPYHGRKTSNGETYNMYERTAAHLYLPFDTKLRVKNLDNGRTCEVRINDRGPFVDGRIIDLSLTSAKEMDMIGPGTAKVELTILELGQPKPKTPKGK